MKYINFNTLTLFLCILSVILRAVEFTSFLKK